MYSIMIQSMTGFGSAEEDGCRVEVRSINHRFLDVSLRAPSFLTQLEIPFRNILKEYFSRGKCDISISVSEQAAAEISVNVEFVRKIHNAFKALQEELSIAGEININGLIGLHDMFIETSPKYDILEKVTGIFRQALKDMLKMRATEGESLAGELMNMAGSLASMNETVKASCGRVLAEMKEKFNERLTTLLEGREVDESRILQEAAIMAARLDISEEIARIESHVRQFGEILNTGGIIGRKLDFILQELNREVNTIASKSADYEVSSITVEMKTVIEKMREQVQNIQ
jgi:uncharacterized protein (TIGR00255 family)